MRSGLMNALAAVMILALAASGCTRFEQGEDTGGQPCGGCADGLVCTDGGCVVLTDILETVDPGDIRDAVDALGRDADAEHDTMPDADTADASDIADAETTDDAAADAQDVNVVTDVPTEPTVGKLCQSDRDCVGGQCVVMASAGESARRVCTGECEVTCPLGMGCINYEIDQTGFKSRCEPFENGLCFPCETASDCIIQGAQCVAMTGGRKFCTTPCEGADSHCPYGFECRVIDDATIPAEYRAQCQPSSGGCDCVVEMAQATFPCAIENDAGLCTGALKCYPEVGWTACSAPVPMQEACDGRDNDCDGQTDEGFSISDWDGHTVALGNACGTGVCQGGTVVCLGTAGATCSTAYLAAGAESCGIGSGNGRDDDCNGQTDEGCEVSDADGDGVLPRDGDCNDWDAAFKPGATEPCCPLSITDPAEAVRRFDRNCNGLVTPCDDNDADNDGFSNPSLIPALRDCDDSDPLSHPGAREICDDGKDNDCVGDGDLHCCYTDSEPGCTGPLDSDGDRYVGAFDCNDDNPAINPGAAETCDGVDNDCDGITDGGNPGGLAQDPLSTTGGTIQVEGGSACGTDEGECSTGTWVCVHYADLVRLECIGGKVATEETCDGLDNDCDGQTDESFTGIGETCDGDDMDLCANGRWSCNLTGTGIECVEPFELSDIAEICGDGIDQDCDGATDDLCFPGDLDGDGYTPPADCDDTRAEVRPWAIEPCCDYNLSREAALALCDWDCNGMTARCNPVDLDFDGFFDAKQGGTDCDDANPDIYPEAPEKCGDGIDQDCYFGDPACGDVVDLDQDGFSPPADCNDNNRFVNPWAAETCNDVDDNCNGVTDEGNPDTSTSVVCGSSEGACRPGVEVCVHPAGAAASVMCVPEVGPSKEMCDGIDNNCNGRTDETFRNLGLPCDGPDTDQCRNGRWECSASGTGTVCGPELATDIQEICDGIDNDCDGQTDEGFTFDGLSIGSKCEGYGICGEGTVVCSLDGVRATCSTNWDGPDSQAQEETCDGVDNDCDNAIDNGMTWYGLPLGSLCRGVGECGTGHIECNPATLKAVCSSNPDGSASRATRERCDGRDNDCDGHVDNGLVFTEWDCMRRGVCSGVMIPAECSGGTWVCDYTVVPDFQADEARCDDRDNDCDGSTDEGFDRGAACDGPDYDKCKNGVFTCRADGSGVECGPETIENITEKCNRKDDDCDGRTDEDFPVGELCDGPDGDLCKNGSFTCAPDGNGVVCGNEWIQNVTETCNAADDDCDGTTDEGFDTGRPCDGPDEDLCQFGRTVCNQAGNGVECYEDPSTHPTDETCNGADDNCDGTTDEGFLYQGNPVGGDCTGIGICGAGKVVCNPLGTAATCSTNPDGTASQAVTEICDTLDNDCDGFTDEGQTYMGLALGQPCVSQGKCAGGTVVCSPTDRIATCSTMPNGTEPGASDERCDGIDNDCDGYTDEDLTKDISTCRTAGICLPSLIDASCISGRWACDYSRVPGYDAAPETKCDGVDNNCDGVTDETWTVGDACDGSDSDMCADGFLACRADLTGVECIETGSGKVEACGDSTDNDCDGTTDEEGSSGCVPYFYSKDGDAFGTGTSRCLCFAGQVAGYTATVGGDCNDNDAGIYPQARELCNLKDDDCDGFTDEDPAFSGLGGPCDSDDTDTCANGVWICSTDKLGLACSGDYNRAETCNGVDDDCNGQTDETWQIGQACDGGDADRCMNGTWSCRGDGTGAQCIEQIFNVTERCNGLDDDCDGFTDEDFQVGRPCDGSDTDSCANGTYTCSAAGTGVQCVNEPASFPGGSEICDGLDNDCDGSVDETWPSVGQKCDSSDTDTCATGMNRCASNQISIECTGDVVCAPGATCTASGSAYVADACQCGAPPKTCSRTQGSECTNGVCKCGTGAACTGSMQCLSDGLGGYSCR